MARRTMPTCLAVLFSAIAFLPSVSQADHLSDLVPLTEQFRCTAERFEALACRRPLSSQDHYRIRSLTRKVCRLAEAVKCNASRARVMGDLNAVRHMVRLVDHRINRHCGAVRDPLLMRKWDAVKCQLVTVEQAISRCTFGACAPAPGLHNPLPPAIVPPADARFNRGYDRRFADPWGRPVQHGRSEFGRYDYNRHSAPPWLDVLVALLSR